MTLSRSDFRFFHRLRVRWAEVDMQKIVFNAHYLMYFDTAISDYWRALALPYHDAMERLEGDLYVVKATVEFHASAQLDDQIEIAMRCGRIGKTSMTFSGAIFRGNDLLISGEIVYVFADPASQTSRQVPQALRDIVEGYEAGQAMAEVKTGSWTELGTDARALRKAVFVDELSISRQLEADASDAAALHAVAYNRLGQAVATGRLLADVQPGVSHIGRMAVHRVLRGGALGRQVMQTLVDAARARGDRELLLNAQRSAVGFYERLGWTRRGAVFVEAGIEHQEMRLILD